MGSLPGAPTGGPAYPVSTSSPGAGEALADAPSGQDISHAAADALFAELGNNLLYEYCFARETQVVTRSGLKAIDQLRAGEEVLAAHDRDPQGPLTWRPVQRVFHNAPARLWNVHMGDAVVRASERHPWFVVGRGWIGTADLRVGDELRTASGVPAFVSDLFDSGDVEPVFNLQVAD